MPNTRAGIALTLALPLSALCVTCFVLSAPLAHAGSFSATAIVVGTGLECAQSDGDGGSGFASASFGPVSCTFLNPNGGGTLGSTDLAASGSWVTGDFSASAGAFANPHSGIVLTSGTDTFADVGLVTLPAGMPSASITLGVTGLSGDISAGPASTGPGGAAGLAEITLQMAAGGSGGTSGTSAACLFTGGGLCPDGVPALPAFGPGALAPITLIVHNGDTLQLSVSVEAETSVVAGMAPFSASANITVDPVFLTLPPGVTFDSGITGFLSGPGAPVPEPGSLILLLGGLLGLCVIRRAHHLV